METTTFLAQLLMVVATLGAGLIAWVAYRYLHIRIDEKTQADIAAVIERAASWVLVERTNADTPAKISAMLAYIRDGQPDAYERLVRKFGAAVVDNFLARRSLTELAMQEKFDAV